MRIIIMNKRLEKAKKEHEEFLIKMGVHPKQIKRSKQMSNYFGPRRKPSKPLEEKVFLEDISAYRNTGAVKGILANINKEPVHVQNQIREIQSRVMPLFNKGGLQLASKNEDLTTVGSRSRRG